jgi:ureidoglycolate lyase
MTRQLTLETLTAEAFEPFGQVIEVADDAEPMEINRGVTKRYDDLAFIDTAEEGGRTSVSIFRSLPLPPPVRIRTMERHPQSSQAYIPLERVPFLVVVAPPGDFDPNTVRGFFANGWQGVNYARGVWHHFNLALDTESDFLVIDRAGPGENLDEVSLPLELQWRIDL